MTSSTAIKKGSVDYLWDWANEKGYWAEQLVKKVVQKEGSLSDLERKEIFEYFYQSIFSKEDLPPSSSDRPTYHSLKKHIQLESLSDVTGVNNLTKNQKIQFSPNLTIIYGENGTGKTSYGRILKALGFSYDPHKLIYSNIYDESEQQKSVSIEYKVNDSIKKFSWNGENSDDNLKNISIFNSDCVQISLSTSRGLIVSPIGFHLFDLISIELREVEKLLNDKISKLSSPPFMESDFHECTPQFDFIKNLSKDSDIKNLSELSNFSPEDEEKIKTKKDELSKLNKPLLKNEIDSLESKSKELEKILDLIEGAKKFLNTETWHKLIELNKEIAELENSSQNSISKIVEGEGIVFSDSQEFKSFLSAAEAYIKVMGKVEYPEDGDLCVYCKQPLQQVAKDLLMNYRTLFKNEVARKIAKAKEEKQKLIYNANNKVSTNLHLNFKSFGENDKNEPIQPQQLKDYNQQLEQDKQKFVEDKCPFGKQGILNFFRFFSQRKAKFDICI